MRVAKELANLLLSIFGMTAFIFMVSVVIVAIGAAVFG
jgi:hypothetical protein